LAKVVINVILSNLSKSSYKGKWVYSLELYNHQMTKTFSNKFTIEWELFMPIKKQNKTKLAHPLPP
jgi:hypothetical protein